MARAASELGWRVWLSGASSGIGAALARELARRGCDVALFARRREKLCELAGELATLAPAKTYLVQPGDARDRAAVTAAIAEAENALGTVDTAILNAGIGDSFFPERNFDVDLIERIFAVNVFGAVYGLAALLPGMLERGAGRIACVSSIAAVRGLPTAAPYCASKAALSTFLESLRVDTRGSGVQLTTVSPGFVKTPMTDRNRFPMPFLQSPERAAVRIVDGLARGKREIHFPRRLTYPLKLLRSVPRGLYEAGMARFVRGRGYHKTPDESR